MRRSFGAEFLEKSASKGRLKEQTRTLNRRGDQLGNKGDVARRRKITALEPTVDERSGDPEITENADLPTGWGFFKRSQDPDWKSRS